MKFYAFLTIRWQIGTYSAVYDIPYSSAEQRMLPEISDLFGSSDIRGL